MASGMRFELNRAGLSEVLTSAPVQSHLQSAADRAVSSSGGVLVSEAGTSPGGGPVPARARVRVGYPSTMSAGQAIATEAKRGTVAKALGAVGGG